MKKLLVVTSLMLFTFSVLAQEQAPYKTSRRIVLNSKKFGPYNPAYAQEQCEKAENLLKSLENEKVFFQTQCKALPMNDNDERAYLLLVAAILN